MTQEGLRNVGLVKDDLFASELEPDSFDLVHARYEICPLGRGHEQMETYIRLARPGGTIVLEDPDTGSWHFNPPAPALERLIAADRGGVPARAAETGRRGERTSSCCASSASKETSGPRSWRSHRGTPTCACRCSSPPPWRSGCCRLVSADELQELRDQGEAELQEPGRWGTTFTLLQCWGRCPAEVGGPEEGGL